jgi:hypothetical protein
MKAEMAKSGVDLHQPATAKESTMTAVVQEKQRRDPASGYMRPGHLVSQPAEVR